MYPTTPQHSTAPLQPPPTTTRKKRIPWHTSSSPIHLHSPPRSGRERIKSQFASQKLYFHHFIPTCSCMRGRCEIQDRTKTRRLGTVGGTSWRYIKRFLLEDGRDYDMLSCPAHVVNNLVFETEKLKKLKKLKKYTCTYLHTCTHVYMWRMWRMRERSSGTCVHGMPCICTLSNKRTSEQDRSFSYREVGGTYMA